MVTDPNRVKEIFLGAVEQPDEAARAAYLDRACGDDAGLRNRIEALLRSHDPAGSFLGTPAAVIPDPKRGDTIALDPTPGPGTTRDGDGKPRPEQDDEPDDLQFLSPATRPDSMGRLGHYEMLQVLGRGGFGIVFRAFDDMLQRVVAVKVMAPQIASLSPARKRFLREARSSAAVRHENVVHIYEVGEQPLPHLVMEFIPGETLQQKLDRCGPLDVPEVLRIGRQIAEGLAAAHACDLIHRDIKPGNILLEGGSHKAKITDFGLARAADDASISQSGVVAGTPMFMSPEQALGHEIDQRADLFSLGSVLYQMASGRPPFRAPSALAVLKRVAEESPRPIPEIIPETPDWLCGIIAKLHAKNPDERFQSAREVADLLADCEAKLRAKQEVKNVLPAARRDEGRGTRGGKKWVAAAAFLLLPVIALAVMEFAGVTHLFRQQETTGPIRPGDDPTLGAPVTKKKTPPNQVTGIKAPEPNKGTPSELKNSYSLSEIGTFKGHSQPLTRAFFGPTTETVWTSSFDKTVRQFDRATGRELNKFEGHSEWVWGLAVSGDGRKVLSAGQDKTLKLWDVASGIAQDADGHEGVVTSVALIDKDRKAISISWDRTVRIWDLASLTCVKTLTGHSAPVWGLALSRDETRAVTGSADNTIIVWDLIKQQPLRTIRGHTGIVGFVDISFDGKRIASTSDDGTLRVWNLETGAPISIYEGHKLAVQGVAFSPDGKLVASTNYAGEVHLTDAATGQELTRFNGLSAIGSSIRFSPDGATILGGFHDGTARLFRVAVGDPTPEAKPGPPR